MNIAKTTGAIPLTLDSVSKSERQLATTVCVSGLKTRIGDLECALVGKASSDLSAGRRRTLTRQRLTRNYGPTIDLLVK